MRTIHPDGSLTAHRSDHPDQPVRLPADYVAQHIELVYALTAHRAQGATVDIAHVIATPTMTREQLYVALTRGRHANHAWTATDHPTDEPHHDRPADTGAAVLARILDHRGPGPSAHDGIAAEQDRWGGTAQLTAEHHAINAAAQSEPSAAAVNAMHARRQLIEQHADQLLRTAIRERQPWLTHLGRPPADSVLRQRWMTCARTIAAYRDRHGITDRAPLGQHERHAPSPHQPTGTESYQHPPATGSIHRPSADRPPHLQPAHRPDHVMAGAIRGRGPTASPPPATQSAMPIPAECDPPSSPAVGGHGRWQGCASPHQR